MLNRRACNNAISSPEAAQLVSTRNRNLCKGPTPEVHDSQTSCECSESSLTNLIHCEYMYETITLHLLRKLELPRGNLVPRGPNPFGQKTGITTSGQVQHRKSTIHGFPVTLCIPRVKSDKSDWFWSQSIVFTKPFKPKCRWTWPGVPISNA